MVRRVGVGRVHRAGVDGVEGEPAHRVCICGAGGVGLLRDGLRLGGAARLRGTGRARVDELDPVVGDVRVLHRVRDVVGLVSDATRRGGAGTACARIHRLRPCVFGGARAGGAFPGGTSRAARAGRVCVLGGRTPDARALRRCMESPRGAAACREERGRPGAARLALPARYRSRRHRPRSASRRLPRVGSSRGGVPVACAED